VQRTGPPGWEMGVVLTTPPRRKFLVTKHHIKELRMCEVAKDLQKLQSHGGGILI
jgi:hypothetical protein